MSWSVTADELSLFVKNRDTIDNELKDKYQGVEGLAEKLKVDLKSGLDEKDIDERKAFFGTNVLPEKPPRSFLSFWFEALQDRTLIILGVASLVSIIIGLSAPPPGETRATSWIEGTAILIAVLIVSGVTSGNDFVKDRKFRQLSAITEDRKIKVIRKAQQTIVSTKEVVVGDVVALETGDYIPADLIYISGQSITVDESPMTGEPEAVHKNPEDPFFLSGCMVQEGVAHGIVIATGPKSQWGQIKANLEKEETKTPLQENLEVLAENIGKLGLLFAIITFVGLVLRWPIIWYGIEKQLWEWGHLSNLVSYFIIAITIVVVAVPEGLPLAVTLSLAYSMIKMMKDQNLVRHLAACETMGGATQICSDKTGTLTQNRMTVTKIWLAGNRMEEAPTTKNELAGLNDRVFHLFTEGVCINSNAYIQKKDSEKPDFIGAKTECALLVLSDKLGVAYEDVRKNTNVAKVFPFSSKKKKMSTIVRDERGDLILYCKGASEVILDLCTKVFDQNGGEQDLPDGQKEALMNIIQDWASQGLRTLSLTYTRLPNDTEIPEGGDSPFDKELTLIAIVGIEDPVRPEVPDAVATCKRAGITVRMLTGDNILTAKNIGKKCGIFSDDGVAIEGPSFRKLATNTKELDELIPKLQIIARCSPDDKLILVKRLRVLGEVVAVTGDGTNDSPALREADVGFAMGISGTEVAKDASDIILMDDNFSSIVKAVLWGRNVYDSIRKFIQFQLTVNIVAVLVACIGALSDGESPLKAVQLLWVNLIMDTMAALALATEAPTPALLDRPPYGRFSPLITNKMWRLILGQAFYQLFVCFFILYYGHQWSLLQTVETKNGNEVPNDEMKQTIIFNAFVFAQIFNEFNARNLNDEKNMFSNLFGNWIFVGVVVFTVGIQAILVQFGGHAFQTHPLNGGQWLFCLIVGFISIPIGLLIRFIPVPPDRVPSVEEIAKKNAKRQKGETKPLLISDKEVELVEKEKEKGAEGHTLSIDGEKKRDEVTIAVPDSPDTDRRGSLPPSNWEIAGQVLTQIRVVDAFRKPSRGSTYGGNFKM